MRRMTDSIRDYALEIIRLLTNLQLGGSGGGDASSANQLTTINSLSDILTELREERKTVSVTRLNTTSDGTIPANTIAYSITNLGDGTNDNQTAISVDGITVPSSVTQINANGNSSSKYPAVNYITNGNTLFIQYELEL